MDNELNLCSSSSKKLNKTVSDIMLETKTIEVPTRHNDNHITNQW